jgi:hypothetical protein
VSILLHVVVIIKREMRPNVLTKHDMGLCSPVAAQVNEKKKKKGEKLTSSSSTITNVEFIYP